MSSRPVQTFCCSSKHINSSDVLVDRPSLGGLESCGAIVKSGVQLGRVQYSLKELLLFGDLVAIDILRIDLMTIYFSLCLCRFTHCN